MATHDRPFDAIASGIGWAYLVRESDMPRLSFLILLLAVAGLPAADYPIKLSRPDRAGDKFSIHAIGLRERHLTVWQKPFIVNQEDERCQVDLQAELETVAVDERQHAVLVNVNVVKATCDVTGTPVELLPPGTLIVAEYANGKMFFKDQNGGLLPEQTQQRLGMVILMGLDRINYDLLFGTIDNQLAGGTWPANAAGAAQYLTERQGLPIAASDLAGTAKLIKVLVDQDQECLRVDGTIAGKKVALPLPPDFQATKSAIRVNVAGLFPANLKLQPVQQGILITGSVEAAGKYGPPGNIKDSTLNMDIKRQWAMSLEALPPAKKK
jgi:hypothetical protein